MRDQSRRSFVAVCVAVLRVRSLGLVASVLSSACARARPQPILAPRVVTLAWNQEEPVAVASAYHYTVAVDGGPHVPLVTSCVAAGVSSVCSARLPQLAVGHHQLTIAVTAAGGERQVAMETVEVAP